MIISDQNPDGLILNTSFFVQVLLILFLKFLLFYFIGKNKTNNYLYFIQEGVKRKIN